MSLRAPAVAHIASVSIRIHWSWPVLMTLVVGVISQMYHTLISGVSTWILLSAGALWLLGAVAIHECGRLFAAARCRVSVHTVLLFAFGSLLEADDETINARQELSIALAGPCMSLSGVLISLALWFAAPSPFVELLALQAALANGVLLLFSLLPSYPLDGGRTLLAVFRFLLDNQISAARMTLQLGRIGGWALIIGGALHVMTSGDILNGALVGFIGIFLLYIAATGYTHYVLRHMLTGITVADLMQRVYRAVAPDLQLDQFVGRYVLGQSDQSFPVLLQPEQDTPQPLLGWMTVRNLRRFGLREWAFTYVGDAMTPAPKVHTLAPDTSATEAFRTLMESGEDQLPVVVDGKTLLGLLRRRDVVLFIQRRLTGGAH
jgi:Zn-dependent protease